MSWLMKAALGRAQQTMGRTRLGARVALKIKNQCDMIIGARVANGQVPSRSGEEWLAQLVAPTARYFVDVGANVGEWTLMFARFMSAPPAGLLFEPHPSTAARLRSVVLSAKLEACEIVEAAAGDRTANTKFFAQDGYGEASSLYMTTRNVVTKTVDVNMRRLDDELSSRNIQNVDMLKIDAEGHDFFVMLGTKCYIAARRISVIQFEYNSPWIDAGATLRRAFDFLESNGYKIRLLRGSAIYELDVRVTGEFFKYSNFIAYCPGPLGDILDQLPCRPAL
jgi:FkbM family methyltransferase